VVTAVEKEIDNTPDMTAAVDMEDQEDGNGVDLEEKPQNLIELQVSPLHCRTLTSHNFRLAAPTLPSCCA
jgi:hypothetical protein